MVPAELEIEDPLTEDNRAHLDAECQRLLQAGPEGVTTLLERLSNPIGGARLQVIEALGESGDPRVLPALLRAFRRCFVRGSSRLQMGVGIGTIILTGACVLSPVWQPGRPLPGWMTFLNLCCVVWLLLPFTRRNTTHEVQALTRAILRIAERHPSPEMSSVVDDLRIVAADRFHHSKEARQSLREAHTRLKELTDGTRDLPVISAQTPSEADSLPRV